MATMQAALGMSIGMGKGMGMGGHGQGGHRCSMTWQHVARHGMAQHDMAVAHEAQWRMTKHGMAAHATAVPPYHAMPSHQPLRT